MNITTPPGIINQDEFNTATAKWLDVISGPDETLLQQAFTLAGNLLCAVSYPVERLIKLVSTVGLHRVKTKFGLVADGNDTLFTLILFAVDENDERISSYYVNDDYRFELIPPFDSVVPNLLAQTWLDQWEELSVVEPDLFDTSYGPLQGYTFEAADFLFPLTGLDAAQGSALHARFGLHKYYRDGSFGPEEARTFGLLLQLYTDGQPGPDEPFFDLSMPCPPTC